MISVLAGQGSDIFILPVGTTLASSGDDSGLVTYSVGSSSFATVTVLDSNLSTLGNGSGGFVQLSNPSDTNVSNTFVLGNSPISTLGNDAPAILLGSAGDNSDRTFAASNSTFSTQGDRSLGVSVGGLGSFGTTDATLGDIAITTQGAESPGFVHGSIGDGSSRTTTATNLDVSTVGNDSGGFLVGEGGTGSVSSVTIENGSTIATQGARSQGVSIGGLGDNSSLDDTIADTTITTVGDDSPGYFTGQVGSGSAKSTTATNLNVSTQGDRSTAFEFGGVGGVSSVASLELSGGSSFSTAGDDSPGVLWDSLPGNDSTSVVTNGQTSISTTGDRSPGFVFGRQDAATQNGGPIDGSAFTFDEAQSTIDTTGTDSPGLIVNGFGDGASNGNGFALISDPTISTSGDRSTGMILNTGSEGATDSTLTTFVLDAQIRTSGEDADGLLLNSGSGLAGATNSNFTTLVDNADVETTGENADGIVLGSGLGEDDGVAGGNTLGISNSRGVTSGANANALVISENTFLAHSSAGNPDSAIDTFDNFVATGSGGRSIQNNGTIDGGPNGIVLTPGSGLRGNIANSGTITSSGPNAVTYDTAANTDDIFELQTGGVVNGNVLAGNGNDQFILGGDGTDSFDHTLLGTQYQGFDEFIKEDSSIWTLIGPDSAAPIIPGTITGGTLVINPVLSGFDLTVGTMGRLEGIGAIGNLINGGTFAPGGMNTAGAFSVAGDALFQAGGTTQIDIFANGTSDLIDVAGTATLGGDLFVNGVMYPSGFPIMNEYTVLTSPGAVLGSFDSVTDNLPDVDAMVTILPPTGPLDPLDPNRPGTVVISYERSGDDSDKSILVNSVQANAQMGFLFNDVLQQRARLLTCGSPTGRSGWTSGLGGSHDTDPTSASSGYSGGYGGFAAGVDNVIFTDGMYVRGGIAGGYIGGSISSNASSAMMDSGFIGSYLSLCGGPWLVSGSASAGFSGYDINRVIQMGAGSPMIASGDPGGGTAAFSLASSYNLAQGMSIDGRSLRFAPIARLDYLNGYRNDYGETGATLLNLSVNDSSYNAGLFSTGVEMGTQYRSERGVAVQTFLDVRWQHLFGDQFADTSSMLTNVGGAPFETSGVAEARDQVAVGVGMSAQMTDRVALEARYDTAYSDRSATHRGSAGITIRR